MSRDWTQGRRVLGLVYHGFEPNPFYDLYQQRFSAYEENANYTPADFNNSLND